MLKKIILIGLSIIFLHSCQSAKDALQGKNRSESSDEFLVEKKNPLSMPPDFKELPNPSDDNLTSENSTDTSVKSKIKSQSVNKSNNSSKSNKNTSIEKSIIEKINN